MTDKDADILMKICKVFGANAIANLIDFRSDVPEKKLYEVLNKFVDKLERKYKTKIFQFRDRTKRTLIRYYIIDFYGSITINGEPSIIINDFQEGLQAEKNPVLKLELIYNDIEIRDKDLEDLKLIIS